MSNEDINSARRHIERADVGRNTPTEHALVGIGYALIALVEALEGVTPPEPKQPTPE